MNTISIYNAFNFCRCIRSSNVLLKGSGTRYFISNNVVYYSNGVQTRSLKIQKKFGPMSFFLLTIPLSAFSLGVWQIQRKKWKEGLIENLMIKTKIPPIPLPLDDEEVNDLEYRAVTVEGEFDHANEMYLGPRSCLVQGQSKANEGKLISTKADGVSGYLVVTPFILSDTKEKILVNRGWVPFKQKLPGTRREGQLEGELELTGIVRLTEPRPQFSPLNKPDARIWFFRNVEKMAETVDARPVFIDADFDSTVKGGPIGGQTRSSLRNEHFSYILTWFSLGAATSVMWYFRFIH